MEYATNAWKARPATVWVSDVDNCPARRSGNQDLPPRTVPE